MSDINIMYGYALDFDGDYDAMEEAENQLTTACEVAKHNQHVANERDSNVIVQTGYSVSAFEPDTMVVGVVLREYSNFYPGELTPDCITPSKDDIQSLPELPEQFHEYLIEQQPRVWLFMHNDD